MEYCNLNGNVNTEEVDSPNFTKEMLLFIAHPCFTNEILPVRVQDRINPPHPFVCYKTRLNGAVLRMRPEKPTPRVTAGVA
jgi:hypothetical protein